MPEQTPTPSNEQQLTSVKHGFQWKWVLPFFAIFMPILLLAGYSLHVATQSVHTLVEEENTSAAGNLTQLLTQDVRQNVKLAHAIASIPGTINAVKNRDEVAMRTRLKAIMVSNPKLHRAFVTGTGGVLWSEFPTAEGAYGSNYGDWTWFNTAKTNRLPYVSGLYIRPQYPEEPVFAIAMPILDKREFLGVLVFEYRVSQLSDWLRNIRLGISGHMYLLDQHGSLVAHPLAKVGGALMLDYADEPEVYRENADLRTVEYTDPLAQENMIATVVPISMGENTWYAVAQQPTAEAYALLNEVRVNLAIAGGMLTLFTLFMVVMLARMSAKTVRLNEELALKNQALKDFTSIVSHQLKAPITAMRWNLEMALDGDYGELSPELRDLLQEMHGVNISNYHLVMDILNVSRLDRGVVAVDMKPVSINELIERAVRDYKAAAEKAGLYLKIEHEDANATVMADLEKTAESVTNSISNALKYTKEGGITIKTHRSGDMVVIEVTDTGTGMPQETVDNLFSRDGVKKANTSAESSSGLGLYIAKQFMQMQGGDVTVTSEEGKGTTFTYTLKIKN